MQQLNQTQEQQPYLGQKGYTLFKQSLTAEQRKEIISELTVRPFTASPVKGAQTEYPVYRESNTKYYLPRHYGEHKFGLAEESKLPDGEDISLNFVGQLREYQTHIVNKYVNHVKKNVQGGGGLIELRCGGGKCLAKGTPVMLSNGEVIPVEDVELCDELMGDDGAPRKILSLARGRERMYRVSEAWVYGSTSYVVNESHILSLRENPLDPNSVVDMPLRDALREEQLWGYRTGCLDRFAGSPPHPEYAERKYTSALKNYRIIIGETENLLNYDALTRRAILAGIVDSDECVCNNNAYIINVLNKGIADRIVYLVRSLGLYARKIDCPSYTSVIFRVNRDIPIRSAHKLYRAVNRKNQFSPKYENEEEDDKYREFEQLAEAGAYPIKIQYVGEDDYYGFEIDGNRRFVLGDFTVTHNTVLTLKIVEQIAKKTLILVQRESLADQWVERIQQFIPGARIGRIQGSKVAVDDCDIVLGMLQSISMKEYPDSLFSSFGFVVIDEVHHISSEVFSRALFSVVAKYMLGLSATMERADRTTYVFKMFLGDIVYEDPKELTHEVKVRAITYESPEDAEYNKVVYDFRGNTQNSTMVAKLCAYKPRTEFIIRVIQDLLVETGSKPEDGAAKIMILAQQKKVLGYIMDALVSRGIATAGYYMGGMKAAALKESETKQIVIGTYAMAQEGLDIKSLTTLVMVTPMVNIEQAVGRIKRVTGIKPIVVDLVDTHKNFQNQWRKRRAFYKSEGCEIVTVKSGEYLAYSEPLRTPWKLVYAGKRLGSGAADCSKMGGTNEDADEDEDALLKTECLVEL
jgi:superfamily II DNA or RNA helicase